MREIRDSAKQNNAERVAVMTALNIANDLLRAGRRCGATRSIAHLARDDAGSRLLRHSNHPGKRR